MMTLGSWEQWPYQWILIGLGVVLWIVGTTVIRRQDAFKGSPVGRTLMVLGVASVGFGVYAGFKGPINVGPITVPTFSFAHAMSDSQKQAFSYAKGKVTVSRRPATAWRGTSDKALEYTINNNGSKSISWLLLRFGTGGGGVMERKLRGPFAPRKTTRIVMKVPKKVNRSYFKAVPAVEYNHIVGASF
jgi:hypothetical protein